MRKHLLLSFLIFLFSATVAQAQKPDSIYFYKNGTIVYGEATTQIDSLTFLASNYYDLQRSEVIYHELASHPELSIFTSMIERAGFATNLINKTIWAPTNTAFASMDPLDLLNMNTIHRILNNQICEKYITTSFTTAGPYKVRMITGKDFSFSKTVDGYALAGNLLLKSNIRSANSIIHIIDGKNPYLWNIWEYIEQADGLDSLRACIRSMTTMKQFRTIYFNGTYRDTITLPQCDVLEFLAKINEEDSIYTAILPDNNAFMDAYNRLLPYCKSSTGIPAPSDAAKWMILRELFIRDRKNMPLTDNFVQTVSGTKYLHPDSLFLSSNSPLELTNGLVYKVSQLKAFEPGFQKRATIIEAENKNVNKLISANYDLTIITNNAPSITISNGKYMYCKPTSTSSLSPLTITLPLRYTLAMNYNLYAVFVPTYITDTTDLRPYKLDLYMSTNGDVTTGSPSFTKMNATNVLTNPNSLTKVLVASNFAFPSCSVFHDPGAPAKVLMKIRDVAGTSMTEMKNYNRSMCIDYFLLEPVE
jgi:hypothetical protein